jgi:uncharacterized spore protein YtfJ
MNDMQRSAVGPPNGDLQAPGPADRFLERLAERLGGKASVTAVYGEPVERGGVTVIPVARVRWGFGGGSGSGGSQAGPGSGQGSGVGGGGGVSASPVGYIEIANGKTEFRRIHNAAHLLVLAPLILATGISLGLILRGLRLVVQAQSRGGLLGGLHRPEGPLGRLRGARGLADHLR